MTRSIEELTGAAGEWECMECGYIEEGVERRRPKQCPECDAPASALEFFPDEDDADVDRAWSDETDEWGEDTALDDEQSDEEEG
jgi:hypothetical protein